jgi:hypothetical protein
MSNGKVPRDIAAGVEARREAETVHSGHDRIRLNLYFKEIFNG